MTKIDERKVQVSGETVTVRHRGLEILSVTVLGEDVTSGLTQRQRGSIVHALSAAQQLRVIQSTFHPQA